MLYLRVGGDGGIEGRVDLINDRGKFRNRFDLKEREINNQAIGDHAW